MSNILPTVGRIVLYNAMKEGIKDTVVFPAIISRVNEDGTLALTCFEPTEVLHADNVEQGSEVGNWDWMPFQKDQQARLAKEE